MPIKINLKEGDYLKKTVDLFSMPGLLILSDSSLAQVESDYRMVRNLEKEGLFILGDSHAVNNQ